MCVKCEERVRKGSDRLFESCEDKAGLPLNWRCDHCGVPTYRFRRKDGAWGSERNRFGETHKSTCAAIFSRENSGKVMAPARPVRPRTGPRRYEDDNV